MTISFSGSNLRDDTTSGNADYLLDELPETTPSTSVFDRADVNYRQSAELHGQIRDTRRTAHLVEHESKTVERARCAPMHALETLADDGFAWRDIARVMGVSVPAITKWRKGAGVTGENRLKLARLLALIDMLSDRFIEEPASWLEMPIKAGVGITRMDLLERGRYDLVLELASTHTGDGTVGHVLNEAGQNWRETFVDNAFESYVAEDGVVSIRPKR
jgi:hypothetical protein